MLLVFVVIVFVVHHSWVFELPDDSTTTMKNGRSHERHHKSVMTAPKQLVIPRSVYGWAFLRLCACLHVRVFTSVPHLTRTEFASKWTFCWFCWMRELNLATSLAMVLMKTGGLAVAIRLRACLAVRHESAAGVKGILTTEIEWKRTRSVTIDDEIPTRTSFPPACFFR